MMRYAALHRHPESRSGVRPARVVEGGILGGLPGLLLIVVPVVLAALDLITADQSQIGFVGVPLMILGIFVGSAVGAAGRGVPLVVAGVGAGMAIGVVAGGILAANGVLPGLWLLLLPGGMLAGGAVAAHRCARGPTP